MSGGTAEKRSISEMKEMKGMLKKQQTFPFLSHLFHPIHLG